MTYICVSFELKQQSLYFHSQNSGRTRSVGLSEIVDPGRRGAGTGREREGGGGEGGGCKPTHYAKILDKVSK